MRSVGVLHEPARVRLADHRFETGRVVDGVEDRQPFTLADLAVDLAERGARCTMPEPSSGDEVVGDDRVRPVADGVEHRERRLVARADERVRGDVGDDLGVGAEHVGDACASHDEVAPAFRRAYAYVVDGGTDRGGDVRRQCPRCRRPHQQVVVAVDERKRT